MEQTTLHGKKVGLALSGGAARGLAHVGVLEVLHKEGIPIDMIAGTSAGAVIGAVYAWKQDISQIKEHALDATWKTMAPLIDPSFPKTKIKDLLSTFIGGNIKFSDLKIPLACVATDIETGEEVVINRGSVPDALRVPVDVARQMGADFIIAVNVNPDIADRISKTGQERVGTHKEPNIFQVMMQSIYITTYSLVRSAVEDADVVVEPPVAHIGAGDFQKAQELVELGKQATRDAIPEIKRKLGNLQ